MYKRLGVVGFRTIGREIAKLIKEDTHVELSFVSDLGGRYLDGLEDYALSSIDDIYNCRPDLIIENVNPEESLEVIPFLLTLSDLVVFTLSVFADDVFLNSVLDLCKKKRRRIYVPHESILGLDGIIGGSGALKSVEITTIKSPFFFGRDDQKKTFLYSGPTREACKLYPTTSNIHAAVALAGLGFDQTFSTIISDPNSLGNRHLMDVTGPGFKHSISIFYEEVDSEEAFTPVSAYGSIVNLLCNQPGFRFV